MISKTVGRLINYLAWAYTTNDKEIDVENAQCPIELGMIKPEIESMKQIESMHMIDGKDYIFHLIVRKDNCVVLANITH